MLSGGLFNTTFTGRGVLAVTIYGTPVVLNVDTPHLRRHAERGAVVDRPALDDPQDREDGRRIGRGSGEAYQLCLTGNGIVVVQASEGHPVPKP